MNHFMICKLFKQCGLMLMIACTSAFGQPKTGTIQGKVIDLESKEFLYWATAVLHFADDKNTFRGAQTDTNGHFQIRNIQEGTYKLITSCVGYNTDTLGPFTITTDSLLSFTIQLDPYFGPNADDARRDIDSGKVQIYLVSWPLYTKEQAELAKQYGFEIAYTGCQPMWTSRYDSVVINYLKRRNGENWYDEFLEEWNRLRQEDLKKKD